MEANAPAAPGMCHRDMAMMRSAALATIRERYRARRASLKNSLWSCHRKLIASPAGGRLAAEEEKERHRRPAAARLGDEMDGLEPVPFPRPPVQLRLHRLVGDVADLHDLVRGPVLRLPGHLGHRERNLAASFAE